MIDQTDNTQQAKRIKLKNCDAVRPENAQSDQKQDPAKETNNLRVVSYFVLFMAAVFIVNAMETGSYRTPWPVAILVTIVGLWLFIYSQRMQQHRNKN